MAGLAILTEAAAIAALVQLGLPTPLASAMVAHWAAEKAAKMVDVYGVQTTRAKAALLRQQIAAVKEQYIKKLIAQHTVVASLRAYDIPDETINALLSEWAAQSRKTVLPP